MSYSYLADGAIFSPFCNSPRNDEIRKITIHHMAGISTGRSCAEYEQHSNNSANYCIGYDGDIWCAVDENDRAWTSSSPWNDNQAVTIEVSNDEYGGEWHVSDKSIEALINLCVDICKRNGIERLNFTGDKDGNLTMHKYFAATACPGPYLESMFPYIADEVNKRLEGEEDTREANFNIGDKVMVMCPLKYGNTPDMEDCMFDNIRTVYTVTGIGRTDKGRITIGYDGDDDYMDVNDFNLCSAGDFSYWDNRNVPRPDFKVGDKVDCLCPVLYGWDADTPGALFDNVCTLYDVMEVDGDCVVIGFDGEAYHKVNDFNLAHEGDFSYYDSLGLDHPY